MIIKMFVRKWEQNIFFLKSNTLFDKNISMFYDVCKLYVIQYTVLYK